MKAYTFNLNIYALTYTKSFIIRNNIYSLDKVGYGLILRLVSAKYKKRINIL